MVLTIQAFVKLVLLTNISIVCKPEHEKRSKELLILGNGPSLLADLKRKVVSLTKYDLLAVNHFAESNQYEEFRPNLYCIGAPELFVDSTGEMQKKGIKLFECLANKTQWDITLYIVCTANKVNYWRDIIAGNPHIKVKFFNNAPLEGFNFVKFFLWRYNFGLPRPHNVLIPSIIIAVNQNYKVINIFGADHSWLSEIYVTDDNITLLNQKHFYDYKNSKPETMRKGVDESVARKLHEILHKFYLAFKGYHEIVAFTESQGVQVYNLTTDSFIDAFKRKKELS